MSMKSTLRPNARCEASRYLQARMKKSTALLLVATAAATAQASWVTVHPDPGQVEVRVSATPGALLYSDFEPRYKVLRPNVVGACIDERRATGYVGGWINVGGLTGGDTASLGGAPVTPRIGTVLFGNPTPLQPALRVDLMAHMKLPPAVLTDGNSDSSGPVRTGGLKPPVAVCNAHLSKLSPAARKQAARNGFTVSVPQAIRGSARADCTSDFAVGEFTQPITVKCEPALPLVDEPTVRVEWSRSESCPQEVRFIAQYNSNFVHAGKRLFMGNHFLTPPETYQTSTGRTTVVTTRKLDWTAHAQGALASAPNQQATIEGWVQFNVQPNQQHPGAPSVFTSDRVNYRVTCDREPPRRATTNPGIAPSGATPQRATRAP